MASSPDPPVTGARIIAQSLKNLGVTVIFGLVGVPVSDIAEHAINTVCLVVGGPGVLHAMAGVCDCAKLWGGC
jgi:2-hydroxyacyl-CoA lyase 1